MSKLFVLLISTIIALSSMAFVHVYHIPHHMYRPVHVHRATVPIRHARTVIHPKPVRIYHHPKPVYSPVVHYGVYINPLWIPLLLSSHTIRTIAKTVPAVETQAVEQPVVKQIVQQQIPEYNPNGLLLIQTNFISGALN